MKKNRLRVFCGVLAGSLLLSGMPLTTVWGSTTGGTLLTAGAADAVTVSDYPEFASALSSGKKYIVVTGSFTIRDADLEEKEGDLKGQMKPVGIPEGTTITGNGTGSITSSHPFQIMGDDVEIKDIQLTFNSTDAMYSVPHREIFLAGHSLTMDHVDTYLVGGNSKPGSMAGTEKELLPTVYAGGYYDNTAVGNHASLTVKNADGRTMFQNIYLGHEASVGERTAYSGVSSLSLDADTKVRGVLSAEHTASASLVVTGEEAGVDEIHIAEVAGNAHTVLQVQHAAFTGSVTETVGSTVVDAGGRLQPENADGKLGSVTLANGGCLDLTKLTDAVLAGDLRSESSAGKGKLVLQSTGSLRITGQVSGVTQFQTGSHVTPGILMSGHTYITALQSVEGNFVLSDRDLNNQYRLDYADGVWTAAREDVEDDREVYDVSVGKSLLTVAIGDIPSDLTKKTDSSPYLELTWTDQYDEDFTPVEAWMRGLYQNLIVIRSDYWNSNSEEDMSKTDWGNAICLDSDDKNTNRYYLVASGAGIQAGTYTLLLCSQAVSGLSTVADVKALLAEDVILNDYDHNRIEITLTGSAEDIKPTPNPDPEEPEKPTHQHKSGQAVRENETAAACETAGGYDEVVYCTDSDCKAELSRVHKTIPALGHVKGKAVEENRKAASVGKDGSYDLVVYCTRCNKKVSQERKRVAAPKTIKLGKERYSYDGKAKQPAVTVTDRQGKTIAKKYYKVTYQNNKKAGKASVTVTLKGNYKGTIKKTYEICPKGTSLVSVKAGKKKLTVKWKKQTSQTTGYEIAYAANASFAKSKTKTVCIRNIKSTTKEIKGLTGKKKYYVKVRTYKEVKSGNKKIRIYSDWSKAKAVTTKR